MERAIYHHYQSELGWKGRGDSKRTLQAELEPGCGPCRSTIVVSFGNRKSLCIQPPPSGITIPDSCQCIMRF